MEQPTCLVCGDAIERKAGKTGFGRIPKFCPAHRKNHGGRESACAIRVLTCVGCDQLFVVPAWRTKGRLRCGACWPTWKKRIQRESGQRLAAARRPCPLGRASKVHRWDDPVRVKWRATHRRRHCHGCGDVLANKLGKWCSERCYNQHGRPVREGSTPIAYGNCRECGKLFVRRANQLGQYCSRGQCAKRAGKRTRRHRLRTNGPSEIFTLREIAERDGWRCHLCLRKINKLLDPQHPRAASIDHLVPVSDDGLHLRENVAIAHRECNSLRGVAGNVQLRLIG